MKKALFVVLILAGFAQSQTVRPISQWPKLLSISDSTMWVVTDTDSLGNPVGRKSHKVYLVDLKRTTWDSSKVNNYFVAKHANGDTTFIIKTAGTGGDNATIMVRGTTTHGPLIWFKTTTVSNLWDLGGINSTGQFLIGNVTEGIAQVTIDTGAVGAVKIPRLQRVIKAHGMAWLRVGTGITADTTAGVDDHWLISGSGTDTTMTYAVDFDAGQAGYIDSLKLRFKINSTAGDSVSNYFAYSSVGVGEVETLTTFNGTVRDTVDYGTTANLIVERTFDTTSWPSFSGDRVVVKYGRDNTIANNESAGLAFKIVRIYTH